MYVWKERMWGRWCTCLLPRVMYCRDVHAAPLTFSMKWKVSDASGVFGGAFLFFRRWTAMHYWLQNTPAMLFHLYSKADQELRLYFCFFIPDSVCIMCAPLVCVCVWCLPVCPLSHLLFTVTPSGRLNGRYAETTPLSPHPSARCADRELRKTKDKR